MRLDVSGKFPEGKSFYVYVNGEAQDVDEVHEVWDGDETTSFDLPDGCNLSVGIEEIYEASNHTLPKIIFFIVTLPVQAVFRMFFTDGNWLKDIQPYTVYTDMTPVKTDGDTALSFEFFQSGSSSKPVIALKNYEAENLYDKNHFAFSNGYFSFIKNLSSCVYVICTLLIAIAVNAFSQSAVGSVLCIATAAGCLAAGIIIAAAHYRKMKNQESKFEKI